MRQMRVYTWCAAAVGLLTAAGLAFGPSGAGASAVRAGEVRASD